MSKWYDYLVAAYGGKDEPARRSAYLTTFADEDPALMLEASKAMATSLKFFPRISELAGLLRQMKDAREADEDQAWVRWARQEKERRTWQVEWLAWTACVDGCGERYPSDLSACPFCADLAVMAGESETVEVA